MLNQEQEIELRTKLQKAMEKIDHMTEVAAEVQRINFDQENLREAFGKRGLSIAMMDIVDRGTEATLWLSDTDKLVHRVSERKEA